MNTIRRFGIFWLIEATTLSFVACSNDNDPAVESEEETLIETPLPANAEPGRIYAIKHDKKSDTCTFQFYFGDNSTEELRDKYSNIAVELRGLDSAGNELFSIDRGLHSLDFVYHWNGMLYDTFTLPCAKCEMIRTFEFRYNFPADNDFVRNNKYGQVLNTQQYHSPHVFFD